MNKALVLKSTGSWYILKNKNNEVLNARIKGKFRIKGIKSTNPIAVGDWVDYTLEEDGSAVITTIHQRKNYIIRKSVNLSKKTHIIASNIDAAFLVVTLVNPMTSTSFIDRFLVSAYAYSIPVVILFNKIDLFNEEAWEYKKELEEIYTSIGYTCLDISVENNIRLDAVKNLMKDKVTMLSGHSGVGKSTLVNALQPTMNIKTKVISETHLTGQHTTTFAQMHEWDFGGYIIDTPGIKGFGLVEMTKEEIGDYFPEIFSLKQNCKFNNCMHLQEPNCAVKQALEKGALALSRYESYLSFLENQEENYRSF